MKSHVCIFLSIGLILTILALLHKRDYEGFDTGDSAAETTGTTTAGANNAGTNTINNAGANTTNTAIDTVYVMNQDTENEDNGTSVTYSADGIYLTLKTMTGSIKIQNKDITATTSSWGRLSIDFPISSIAGFTNTYPTPFDNPETADTNMQKFQYFDYNGVTYKLVGWKPTDPTDWATKDNSDLFRRSPYYYPDSETLVPADFSAYSYFFEDISGSVVNLPDAIYLSDIEFRMTVTKPVSGSESGITIPSAMSGGAVSLSDFTADVRALEEVLAGSGLTVNVNDGIQCGWHYDPETGQAGGYFADTLNSTEFQTSSQTAADYQILKNYICPDYLPTCTGQRATGIVLGKCISTADDCNNQAIDDIIGVEQPTYTSVTVETDPEPVASTLAQRNQYNSQNLQYGLQKMNDILHEGFENQNNANGTNETNTTTTTTTSVQDTDSCNYIIENKCYEQYVDSDKIYYETGAGIFESVFPNIGSNYTNIDDAYNKFTDWLTANTSTIIMWKVFSGLGAFMLQYSTDIGDYRIKIFRSFIAFIFSELYLIYSVYKYIIKPQIPLAVRTIKERAIYA